MNNLPPFLLFCKYVDEMIFQKQTQGSYLSVIVDQAFIDSFCKKCNISLASIIISASNHMHKNDIPTIKGIIALQLYAASKRQNAEGITAKNYRDRLAEILTWQKEDLQEWFRSRQDNIWNRFYTWCEDEGYIVDRCEPRPNAWRYVQYPIALAKGVFTVEDLLYIAKSFVDHGLCPNEDVSEHNFWDIIDKWSIGMYIKTNHGKEVVEECGLQPELYRHQIYNFYTHWNGEYRTTLTQQKNYASDARDYLYYLSGDFTHFDVRDSNLNLISRFETSVFNASKLQDYYHFKSKKGVILFEKDDVYDDCWIERRFLDKSKGGIVLVFKNLTYQRYGKNILFANDYIIIYSIVYDINFKNLFAEDRPYKLEGGLKIDRNTYIKGACPTLYNVANVKFWLDRKMQEGLTAVPFNNLEAGRHTLMFQGYKPYEFNIVEPEINQRKWAEDYLKWSYDKATKSWCCDKLEIGIVGLNFSVLASSSVVEHNTLKRWALKMLNNTDFQGEDNIAIKLIE